MAANHLWATDYRWWAHHIADVARDFDGKCWTQNVQWPKDKDPAAWGITCLQANTDAPGLATDPGQVHTGKNSGYAAINLALHLGATRVLLLGYDMKMDGDKRHWFGAHPAGMEVDSNYPSFIERFRTIEPAAYGMEIWNVTRSTALDCFPCFNLDEVAARCAA